MDSILSIELTDNEFRKIRDILYSISGISMNELKKELVKTRILKRIEELKLNSFKEYLDLIEKNSNEKYNMVDILTTNKTNFFREIEHFRFMRDMVFPNYINKKLTIWSAGCSYGKEPYSIAVELKEYFGDDNSKRILATDISKRVIDVAKSGIYEENDAKEMGSYFKKYFDIYDKDKKLYRIKDEIKKYVSFALLNLMDIWPMRGPFDIIFFCNVMIYFDKTTQERLINRFYDITSYGGYLFVGHSESLNSLKHNYSYVKPSIYRKENRC